MVPALSVVVATWNRTKMVVEAIESVLMQDTPEPIEVIVVDDGSQDGSPAVLTEMAKRQLPHNRMLKIILGEHRGLTSTMQRGIEAASAEYVSLLDSDDIWEIDRASGLLTEERRLGGHAVVYTNYRKMDTEGVLTGALGFDPQHAASASADTPELRLEYLRSYISSVFHDHAFPGSISVFPRAMLQGHYALPEGAATQDFWVVLVAYLKYAVAYLDVATLRVREHPEQHHALADANQWEGLVDEQIRLFSAMSALLRTDIPGEARLIQTIDARWRLTVLRKAALEGDRLACLAGTLRMSMALAAFPALRSTALSNVILSISPRLFVRLRYRNGRRRLDDLNRYGRENRND